MTHSQFYKRKIVIEIIIMPLEMSCEEIQCCRMFLVCRIHEIMLFSYSKRFLDALEQYICYLFSFVGLMNDIFIIWGYFELYCYPNQSILQQPDSYHFLLPNRQTQPCFQNLFIHFPPCGSCTKCNPSTSVIAYSSPPSVSPKILSSGSFIQFLFSASFHLISPYQNPSHASKRDLSNPFCPTIATLFLPFVVIPSHCCFCYISLLGSMIHIQ